MGSKAAVAPQVHPRAHIDLPVIAAIAVTTLFWASAFVAIREARHHYGPGELALGRLIVAFCALSAMMAAQRLRIPARREWWAIIACGVLWLGAYNVALNQGERLVDAGTAAMLVNVAPIMIAVLATWILRERLSFWLLAGLGVAFCGAAVIAISSAHHHNGLGGVLLCVLAAAAYSIAVTIQKPVLSRVSPIAVTWGACLAGVVVLLEFVPGLVHAVGRAPASSTLLIVYLGVGPTAIAFSTWAFALSRSTMARQGATTYLVPPLVILLSWASLDEIPGVIAMAGGVLCLVGVAVTRRRR
ncbi:MAG TPA: DMT family transporter [Solirubrobacteraceae bacterium]|jgi:drug/metabolite transporter (DMT)-like permease|nr:DMT family transporter [Solirubrobacteraceae bacterium]